MLDEERWFYDEAIQSSDEEFKEESIHEWQRCSIGVLASLQGLILKLLLFSALKRLLVFLHAKSKYSLKIQGLHQIKIMFKFLISVKFI